METTLQMQADHRGFRYVPTRLFRTAAVVIGLSFVGVFGGCGSSSGTADAGGGGTGGGSAGSGAAGAGGAAAGRGGTGGAIAGQGGSSGQGGGTAGAAGQGSGGSAGAAGSAAGRTGTDGSVDGPAGHTGSGDGSVVDSAVQNCLGSNPDPCACGRPDANSLSATECAEETRCRAAGGIWEPYFVFLPDGGEHGPQCQTASGAPFDAGSG
jgi:hypothetical protein